MPDPTENPVSLATDGWVDPSCFDNVPLPLGYNGNWGLINSQLGRDVGGAIGGGGGGVHLFTTPLPAGTPVKIVVDITSTSFFTVTDPVSGDFAFNQDFPTGPYYHFGSWGPISTLSTFHYEAVSSSPISTITDLWMLFSAFPNNSPFAAWSATADIYIYTGNVGVDASSICDAGGTFSPPTQSPWDSAGTVITSGSTTPPTGVWGGADNAGRPIAPTSYFDLGTVPMPNGSLSSGIPFGPETVSYKISGVAHVTSSSGGGYTVLFQVAVRTPGTAYRASQVINGDSSLSGDWQEPPTFQAADSVSQDVPFSFTYSLPSNTWDFGAARELILAIEVINSTGISSFSWVGDISWEILGAGIPLITSHFRP